MPTQRSGMQRAAAPAPPRLAVTKSIKIYHSCDPLGTKLLTRFKSGRYTPFHPTKDPHLQAMPVQIPRARGKTTYERRCCKAACEICEDTDLFTDLTLAVAQAHGIREAPLKPGVSLSASAAERLEDAETRGRWMYGHLRPVEEVPSRLLVGPPTFTPDVPWVPDSIVKWVLSIPAEVDHCSSHTHISVVNEADLAGSRISATYQVPGLYGAHELRAGQDWEDIIDERNQRGHGSHQQSSSSTSEMQQPVFPPVRRPQEATLTIAPPDPAAQPVRMQRVYASPRQRIYATAAAQQSVHDFAPAHDTSLNPTGPPAMHQVSNAANFAPSFFTGMNRLAQQVPLPPLQRPFASAATQERQALPMRTRAAPMEVIDLTSDDDEGVLPVQRSNFRQSSGPSLLKDPAAFMSHPLPAQKRLREPDYSFNVKRGRYED